MIKELYINETLFITLNNDKVKPVLIGEQYTRVQPKELKSESYDFIRRYPNIMDKLRTGSTIESYKDNAIVKSIIGTIKTTDIHTKQEYFEVISEADGYSFEESIENLEFSMPKTKKKEKNILYRNNDRFIRKGNN